MRYMGGKARISTPLSKFINDNFLKGNNKPFVDLFCGSCNIVSKIDKNRMRIANDKHRYLIAMWKELQRGWLPPKQCSRDEYYHIKEHLDDKPYLSGFIGFGCSYSGIWMEGSSYASDTTGRNYCLNAYNSTMRKMEHLKDVVFLCSDYKHVDIPLGSVVYCDIPYKNTAQYSVKEVGHFDHDEFYQWVRENKDKYTILISEYEKNIPDDFKIIWRMESKRDIRNKDNKQVKTIEVLATIKSR